MDKKYKAISTIVTQEPGTEYDSETREKRYVIINTESGEIVDDAQGYGYKTAQKAYAGWSYKNRDKSKDKEKAEKERIIARWMREGRIRSLSVCWIEWLLKFKRGSGGMKIRWMLSLSKICWKRTAIRICSFLPEIY